MKRIGLLSDTHGFVPQKVFEAFKDVDEIWHAGDAGDLRTIQSLEALKPVKAVYGNIDGQSLRSAWPEVQSFSCEGLKVLMIHIGGYPGKYEKRAKKLIEKEKPDLFISGHSHILKVMYDDQYDLLHINPGAAGKFGLHQKITFLRFNVEGKELKDLEIIELDRNYPKPYQV
ncbi:MAG: metallophosphatase family protein [Bacteroidetes bacterium]|nr:metallophosphatase family protein [Bacteroidota bacterium]